MTEQRQHCDHSCVCKEYRQWYITATCIDQPCPDSDTCEHFRSRLTPAADALAELKTTQRLLYEFCEWFCYYDCEEKPCTVTVSQLHDRIDGIQKQMKEHPEYLEKWNAKRAEQESLRTEVQK